MGPTRLPPEELLALRRAYDVPAGDIERATADGTLALLAIERLALTQDLRYDLAAASVGTALPEEELRHIWRSLGFPAPQPGEQVFSDVAMEHMAAFAELMHSGVVSTAVNYGMARVIGSSIARLASSLVATVTHTDPQLGDPDGT